MKYIEREINISNLKKVEKLENKRFIMDKTLKDRFLKN
jgi:hypothetical protein